MEGFFIWIGAAVLLVCLGVWRLWDDVRRANRIDAVVDDIIARGTISVIHTVDGDTLCPHCHHSLRSAPTRTILT